MEGETKHVSIKQKNKNMDVIDILKQTLTIYFKNIYFIIFTFLISLPFFLLMIYFETLFQQTILLTPKIISSLPFREKNQLGFYSISDHRFIPQNEPSFSHDYLPLLVQLGFIYSIPLHALEFCCKVLTMDLASKLINSQDSNTKMSLKHMFRNSVDASIMKGTFITSLYTLALSNCLLIAFPWTVNNCFIFSSSTFWCYVVFGMICFVAIGKLLMVYLEWSAIWDMSIVISVLEGVYGIGALRVSYHFNSGGSGIFLQIGVLTVMNTLKWVASVIYYNDCKERKMEKKVDDEEIGQSELQSRNS
ncbi:unnamed protein product [Vicia faba]|uniref:Transmembrane protein n=1 Tax=Vicia faba TaxID=3906 RepID=A0AAV0YKJ0_VICFA|nr:unnamed protein product [Vicia faba]